MEQSKRGGFRPGSGRKSTGETKIPVTIYVEQKLIYPFGNKDNLRREAYNFILGYGKVAEVQSRALTKPEAEIKPVEPAKPIQAPFPSEDPFEPATGLKISQFDELHDQIIGTTTIPQLSAVMKGLKSAVLTPKQRQELETIAKEHSATNMYND